MALADEVTSRYPGSRLVQLTNPNDQDASAVDATILGLACTDVEADFLTYTATAYDNSEAQHVAVAVEGVVAKLAQRTEASGEIADSQHEKYLDRLRALARVTGRDRIRPKTTSVLTVSSERIGTETVYPDTDRNAFEDFVPDPPAS